MKYFLTILLLYGITLTNKAFCYEWHSIDIPNKYISKVEKTNYGLMAGEFDTRVRPEIYNGILLSKDFGNTWIPFGLEDRGITDIKTHGDDIYASTYFNVGGKKGVFKWKASLQSWEHLGLDYSVATVVPINNNVIAGTYLRGLWLTKDNGASWVQKIPVGTVNALESDGFIIIAGTSDKTYKSLDEGESWEEITFLAGKNVKHIAIDRNTIVIGTFTTDGIYISKDYGITWIKSQTFGTKSVGGLILSGGCIFAGKSESNEYRIYKSCDNGLTWENLGKISNDASTRVNDLEMVYSDPDTIIASVNSYGLNKTDLEFSYEKTPIFSRPWDNQEYPLLDYLTAFFDHEYPLLGANIVEPDYAKNFTLNFLGKREPEPDLFYSSHNGTDFRLEYGTNVLSVMDGVASYKYCKDCGNTIVIDHQNGYQTQYMHLQSSNLVTNYGSVPVVKGQIIGKVGLTGKTSGPHLHFSVMTDSEDNSTFNDDYPDGLVDPFGWQIHNKSDPWPNYSWDINAITYSGSISKYLWDEDQNNSSIRINSLDGATVSSTNKTILIPDNFSITPLTVDIQDYTKPNLINNQDKVYVNNTSLFANITDYFGNIFSNLPQPIQIVVKFTKDLPETIINESVKIFYLDEINNIWLPLESTVDLLNKTISAYTNHLSTFAVLGNKNDTTQPITSISLSGNEFNGWFSEYPLITLNTNVKCVTYYSLDDGNNWELYSQPFFIEIEGVVHFIYKSEKYDGTMEEPKQQTLKINTKGNWTHQLIITNTGFTINKTPDQ